MALYTGRFLREGRQLPAVLEEARLEIAGIAQGYGLDFFETIFEMCTYEEINMIASYGGFPTRYPHWRFGMEYLQMQKGYEFGLQKIYEMVINTDPSYAYLLDNNLITDQKLVMAHVYGHVDFFKNSSWFAFTNRKMLDEMANHASQIRRLMDRHGVAEVESFIDVCLSLDNLIDPYRHHIIRQRETTDEERVEEARAALEPRRFEASSYMDRHINPPEVLAEERRQAEEQLARARHFPEQPERDVLGFLLDHADLPRWKRDVLSIIREEAYYFAPQGQTKIMNEGWATFWHTTMMTRDILTDAEVIDYADHHSGTVAQRPGQLNPYRLGVELFRHIEERWDKGRHGKDWMECHDPEERRRWDTGERKGRDKIFEVRRTHNDVTFVDSFLTADFCREQGFFTTKYDPRSKQWLIESREFEEVKKQLLAMLVSKGTPRVYVVDANHANRRELRLDHQHEGMDIQLEWASTVLGNLVKVWGRPVHLDTLLDGKPIRLSHDGTAPKKEERKEEES